MDERTDEITIETDRGGFTARVLVNCAGLQSDLVAAADGVRHDVQIVPFRGEFHDLVPSAAAGLVRHLIYPVPDPDLPFLGVHLSRGIDGGVHVGPNALLALRREGYIWGAVETQELRRLASFPGFWRMARRYWPVGWSRLPLAQQARAARARPSRSRHQRHRPRAASGRSARAGRRTRRHAARRLRAARNRAVHVLNAPSPAATASLVIGESIATRAIERL